MGTRVCVISAEAEQGGCTVGKGAAAAGLHRMSVGLHRRSVVKRGARHIATKPRVALLVIILYFFIAPGAPLHQ